jgi:Skp family chaperone for outer membrane proteins
MNVKYVALSLLVSCAVSAEEFKIRILDTFDAMRSSQEGAKVADKIEAQRAQIAKDLEADGKKLEAANKEVEAKLSTMSKAARDKEEMRLTKMKRDLENKVHDGEETLKFSMQKATEDLAVKVESAVNDYAKVEKPDIIIDKSTGRVIYASGKADITELIKNEMNKKYTAVQSKVGGAAIDKVKAASAA